MSDETITKLGAKALIDAEGQVSGWLAPFGGPFGGKDLDGEFFYGAKGADPGTDFGLEHWGDLPILWGHGQDPEIGAEKVGVITVKEIRDRGLWVQGQLDKQGPYYDAIREVAGKGDMYWSSGTLAHLRQRNEKTGALKQWPVAEATLTLTPANPMAEAAVKGTIDPSPIAVPFPTDPDTVTVNSSPGFTVTFSYPTKEGRRHSASDTAKIQQIHQLLAELGAADPEPEPEPEGPPAYVLTVVGNDVEPAKETDLAALMETAGQIAVARARQLTG